MVENEDGSDIIIRGLWERGTNCILDIRFTGTEAPTSQMKDPSKFIKAAERLKKKKYLQPCLDQHHHFTPFIVSADGLIGKEAKSVLKVIVARTATKAGKKYSNAMGYTRARLSIAIVRASHVCFRGVRVTKSRISNRRPPVGGYGRGGPSQILITSCSSIPQNGSTASR
jgi:hypothetical protein